MVVKSEFKVPGIFIHSTNMHQVLTRGGNAVLGAEIQWGTRSEKAPSPPHGVYFVGKGTDRQTTNKKSVTE